MTLRTFATVNLYCLTFCLKFVNTAQNKANYPSFTPLTSVCVNFEHEYGAK